MDKQYVRMDEHGVYRVGDTRMMLDGIVDSFWDGMSPESIRSEYPAMTLEQVYGAITFYLAHKDEVDRYIEERDKEFERLRAESEKQPNPARDRIRAIKKARAEAQTEALIG